MRVKLIRFFLLAAVALGVATSCFDSFQQDVSVSSIRHGRKFTTSMQFLPMKDELQTKSQLGSKNDWTVYNWNLFIFEDDVLVGKYYKEGQNGGAAGDIEFNIKIDYPYDYLALANVGNQTGGFNPGTTKSAVMAMVLNLSESNLPVNGAPCSWQGSKTFTREDYESSDASRKKLNVQFEHLTGRYDIAVDKSNLRMWSFTVKSLTLKGPGTIAPFTAAGSSVGSANNVVNDSATAEDITKLNSNLAVSFYPLENCCGVKSSITDRWDKVPNSGGNTVDNKYPTFVEMVAEAELLDNSGLKKDVTYRFYLGSNDKSDFNVTRNVSHILTFYPDDETINKGHGENWKITPGSFPIDSRSLAFVTRTEPSSRFRIKAGTTSDQGISRTPSNLLYYVKPTSAHVTLKNASTDNIIASTDLVDLSTVRLAVSPGVEEQCAVQLYTYDGASKGIIRDYLYLDIYNAYFEVLSSPGANNPWEWNETGVDSKKAIQVKTTVGWTASVPTGWILAPSSYTSDGTEQTLTLDVYPTTASTFLGPENEQVTITFHAEEGIGDVPVTLYRRFKPNVTVKQEGVDVVSLVWPCDQYEQGSAKTVTVVSNESWTIDKVAGWDEDKWAVSTLSGNAGNTTLSIYPKTPNISISDITAAFKVKPNRGTEAEFYNVSLTHQAAVPAFTVSPASVTWNWKTTTSQTITITGNVAWTAALSGTNADKFQISASSGSTGGTITVSPKQQNSLTDTDYAATLTFTPQDGFGLQAKTVSLSQTRHPSLTVSPSSLHWSWTETDVRNFSVTSDTDWTVSFVSGSATLWTMTPSSGSGNGTISVNPKAQNDDTVNDKTATIRISGTDVDPVDITLIQDKKVLAPYLTPSPASLSWNWNQHDSKTVTVSSNKEWDFSVAGSDASHFNVTRSGDVLTVATSDNDDETRGLSASISIMCDSNPELNTSVSLSQTKHPALSVSPSSYNWNYNESGSDYAKTITISGDAEWTVSLSDKAQWRISAVRGTAPGSVTVYPYIYNSSETSDKTCTVTFTYAGGSSRTVTLTQYKATPFTVTPTSYQWTGTDVSHKTITVSARGSWTVTPPTGYTTSVSAGTGNGTFEVWPTSPNNTYNDLPAVTMAVTSGTNTINVTLQQLAKEKEYTSAYFYVDGLTSFSFHDYNHYHAYIAAVYDGTQYDIVADVSNDCNWSTSGAFTSYIESADLTSYSGYKVQVYNTTTSSKSGRVTASFSGGTYEGFYVSGSDYVDVSVESYPYISASDVTVDWNDTSRKYNVSYNFSSLVSSSGVASWANFYNAGIRATENNTSTDSRSCVITVSGHTWDNITGSKVEVSDTFTFTQGGKPDVPTYYDYTAAYVETYLSAYDIDEGESVTASAYLYEGTCHTTATSAPTDKSAYTWSTGATVTSSGFTSSNTSVATVSGSTVSGVGAGTSIINSKYSVNSSSYHIVFDDESASLDVHTDVPTTIYKVETDASPSSLSVGEYTTLSATLYSSTNGGSSWSVESTSPDSYSKVSGTSVINISTGQATTVGSGVYRGIFNGYTVGSNVDVTITVSPSGPIFDHYEYKDLAVSISANPDNLPASGGTSTLSYSATWKYRAVYSDNSTGSWIDDSGTPSIDGSAPGFTLSGSTVTASANNGDERSIEVTASYSFPNSYSIYSGSRSASDQVTITQDQREDEITYSNFTVSLSPTSISEGESSTATATIDKYVNGSFSETINVTSSTTFSATTNSSRVSKTSSNTFQWNGTTTSSYSVNIHGSLSSSTYGSASNNATLTVNRKRVLNYISLDRSSYSLTYANLWTMNYTVTAYYSDNSSETVTSVASVVSTPSGISMDPTSGTLHAHAETSGTIKVSYEGKEATATASAVDSWFLQGLEVSGLDGSAGAGAQFNFKIVGSYIKHLSFSEGTSSTIHQEANSISGDLSYINIDWNGSDEYQVSFKGSTPVGTTRSVTLKYINPEEPGWTDNYIEITIYFKKRQSSWEYTGFDTNDNS